jgi:hypothetical protein
MKSTAMYWRLRALKARYNKISAWSEFCRRYDQGEQDTPRRDRMRRNGLLLWNVLQGYSVGCQNIIGVHSSHTGLIVHR